MYFSVKTTKEYYNRINDFLKCFGLVSIDYCTCQITSTYPIITFVLKNNEHYPDSELVKDEMFLLKTLVNDDEFWDYCIKQITYPIQ